jgi:hypothetical protein
VADLVMSPFEEYEPEPPDEIDDLFRGGRR